MDIIQVGLLGITAVFLALFIKNYKSEYSILISIVACIYVAEFATDICRESGYQAIAGQIEIFAKLSILLISMPVLMGFIETLGAFL